MGIIISRLPQPRVAESPDSLLQSAQSFKNCWKKEVVSRNFESDSEEKSKYLATLLLETEMTFATGITGYFEKIVANLSGSTLKKH